MSSELKNFCQIVGNDCYFSKVRILDRWIASIFEHAFVDHQVSPHQFTFLVAIESMGQIASANLLSRYLKMEKSTVSRDLKNLSSKGFLKETISKKDTRRKSLKLTRSGRAAIISGRKSWNTAQDNVKLALEQNSVVIKFSPPRR